MTTKSLKPKHFLLRPQFYMVLCVATWFALMPLAQADIVTEGSLYWNFNYGETFTVQDVTHQGHINFTVTSGTFRGFGTINADSNGGTINIIPEANSAITVASNISVSVYQGAVGPATYFTFTSGVSSTITWTYTSAVPTATATPSVIINEGTLNSTLFMRSDTQTTNNQNGYRLDETNTESAQTITNTLSGDIPVQYGFRVWITNYNNESIELTDGAPQAVVTRSTNGAGIQTSTWTPPQTAVDLGFDCLTISVYLNSSGTWTQRATYVTPVLMYKEIAPYTWTFYLYTNKTTTTDTYASFSFGDDTVESKVNCAGLTTPTWFELGNWQLTTGNIIGFIFYSYYQALGAVSYLLMFLIPAGTLYIRHRTTNVIVFLFVLLGGAPGALVWIFIPVWAAAAVDAILLLCGSFLVWRVIR